MSGELIKRARDVIATTKMQASDQTFAGLPLTNMIAALVTEVERLTERAESAESRLRELASAEAVAFIGQHPDYPDERSAYLGTEPDEAGHIPLIRRPEFKP